MSTWRIDANAYGLPHQAIPAHHEANARPAVRGVKHGCERGKLRKVHTWQSIGAGEGLAQLATFSSPPAADFNPETNPRGSFYNRGY